MLKPLSAVHEKPNTVIFLSPSHLHSVTVPYVRINSNLEGIGTAYAFRNPSKKALNLEISGGLRLYNFDPKAPFEIVIFTKSPDGGAKTVLRYSGESDLFSLADKKGQKEWYLRLDNDVMLNPGAELVFAVIDRSIGKKTIPHGQAVRLCYDPGVNKPQQLPGIIIRSEIQ